MKKNKIVLILLFFLLSACGYKIANKNNFEFGISNYELTGERKINQYLERNFKKIQQNQNYSKLFQIKSFSDMNKTITSKNLSGDAQTYEIEITVKLDVFMNDEFFKNLFLKETRTYNEMDSKFQLKQYENILVRDLVDEITLVINNYLNSI